MKKLSIFAVVSAIFLMFSLSANAVVPVVGASAVVSEGAKRAVHDDVTTSASSAEEGDSQKPMKKPAPMKVKPAKARSKM